MSQSKHQQYKANKAVSKKSYRCLWYGCEKQAINSHSIPRSNLSTISVNSKVYTFHGRMWYEPNPPRWMEPDRFKLVGIGEAGTFKGFCPEHDHLLFHSAETDKQDQNRGMFISMHYRSIALEYCRKRSILEFCKELQKIGFAPKIGDLNQIIETYENTLKFFGAVGLGRFFDFWGGSHREKIDHWALPIRKNFGLSCCGVFNPNPNNRLDFIGYNLIPYKDFSLLALTSFGKNEMGVNEFIEMYPSSKDKVELVKEIVFLKGEEPHISPALWNRWTDSEKTAVRYMSMPPHLRTVSVDFPLIPLSQLDFFENPTAELLRRIKTNPGDIKLYR